MEPAFAICYDYSTPFEQCLGFTADAGFRLVSLGMNAEYSGFNDRARWPEIGRLLESNGLKLDNIHAHMGALASPDPATRQQSVDAALISIEAAAELGAFKTVNHLSGGGAEAETLPKEIEGAKQSVAAMLERARPLGVTVCLENSWREPYMATFRSVMDEFDDPLVRFVYDTSHDHLYAGDRMAVLEQYGPRLATLHVSDNLGENDDHMPPWEGAIDWDRFTGILGTLDYPGPMLLECVIRRSQFKDLPTFNREAFARAQRLIAAL